MVAGGDEGGESGATLMLRITKGATSQPAYVAKIDASTTGVT